MMITRRKRRKKKSPGNVSILCLLKHGSYSPQPRILIASSQRESLWRKLEEDESRKCDKAYDVTGEPDCMVEVVS